MMEKREIAELFKKFGATISNDDVWQVQQATVIKHKALERLAASAGVIWDAPTVLRCERDEAVILVTGKLDVRSEWSIGEALINANYRVTGKQAPYVYAMAEKRAKDRVIIKLCGLHGLYSEDEADEFKEPREAEKHEPQRADDETIRTYCTEFNAQLKRCRSRMDVEKAWSNGLAKRKAFGIEVGDDDYQRLAGFCKDRIEEIALPEDAP